MRRIATKPALFGMALIGALVGTQSAWAQQQCPPAPDQPPSVMPQYPAPEAVPPAPAGEAPVVTRPAVVAAERASKFELDVGLGAQNFTGGLGSVTAVGFAHSVHLGYSIYRSLSIQAVHQASYNAATFGSGLGNDSLQTQSIGAQLRVAPLTLFGISPYAFVGLGATWVGTLNRGLETAAFDNGWAGNTPLGGGIQVAPTRWMTIGAEASYMWLWSQGFQAFGMAPASRPNMWNVQGMINFYI